MMLVTKPFKFAILTSCLYKITLGLISLALAIILITTTLIYTGFGLDLAISLTKPLIQADITHTAIKGSIAKGIEIQKLRYKGQDNTLIDMEDVTVQISLVSLLKSQLYIKRLKIDKLLVQTTQTQSTDKTETDANSFKITSIPLLPLYIERLRINHFKMTQEDEAGQSTTNEIEGIHLKGYKKRGTWHVKHFSFESKQGLAELEGSIDWYHDYLIDLHFQLKNVVYQNPDIDILLSATGDLKGKIKEKEALSLSLSNIEGLLNKRPIQGRLAGTIAYPHFKEIHSDLILGDNKLDIAASFSEAPECRWDLSIKDFQQIHPNFKGNLYSKGQLIFTNDKVDVKANTTAKDIQLNNFALKNLTFEVKGPQNLLDIQLAASLPSLEINSVIQANANSQSVTLALQKQNITFKNELLKTNQLWTLTKSSQMYWRQGSGLEVAPMCMKAQSSQICLKGKYFDNNKWDLNVDAKQMDLAIFDPLLSDYLAINGLSDTQITLQKGIKDLVTKSNQLPNTKTVPIEEAAKLTGKIEHQLKLGKLSLIDIDGVKHHWPIQNASVHIEIKDEITLNSELLLAKTNLFKLKAKIPYEADLDWLEHDIRGKVELKADDFSFLSFFWPDLITLKGSGLAELDIYGQLGDPKLSGKGQFKNLSWPMMNLGSTAYLDTLNYTGVGTNEIQVKGIGRIGKGPVTVTGSVKLVDNKPIVDLNLKGKDVMVINTPEYEIEADPNIHYLLKGKVSKVSGELNITKARLEPKDLSNSISPSKDVVIVTQAQKIQPKNPEEYIHFESDVKINLGNKIRFTGYGLTSKLGGQLQIIRGEDGLAKANGKLKIIEGKYNAYSKTFNIEHGELIYTHTPLDNPYLDIRAQRQIKRKGEDNGVMSMTTSNAQIIAGVQIQGQASNHTLKLYSIPSMRDADIISYLILGRPQNEATNSQGEEAFQALAEITKYMTKSDSSLVDSMAKNLKLDELELQKDNDLNAAPTEGINNTNALNGTKLVVGKQIGENLYFNYSIGLTDAVSTIRLKYLLGKHFRVEADAGTRGTGADIVYSFEK